MIEKYYCHSNFIFKKIAKNAQNQLFKIAKKANDC